jgi:hypothetical protein
MTPVTAAKTKNGIWGLILGGVLAMTIGFAFTKDPNHQEQLQAFDKVSPYQRSTFIEKGGWDKMPGEEQGGFAVARACADGLEVLMKK